MKLEKTIALRVELTDAERVRRFLYDNNFIRNDLKLTKDEKFVYFPLKEKPKEFDSYKILKFEFERINKKPNSYKDLLKIPNNIKQNLPTSYDVVGDIILLKLSDDFLFYSKNIGEALLKTNKNIKTVCISNPVSGELRIRDLKIIAGENNTTTIHKEYGILLKVDLGKIYFSPRLANERKRVANLVQSDETVVDMFAGVAPFSIMIAKYANPKIVYALDKNKDAVKYAQFNVKKNNVLDKVEVINMDAMKIYDKLGKRGIKADRIIMNLPFSSYLFFDSALKVIADSCTIHYYDILKEENIEKRKNELEKIAKKYDIDLSNLDVRKIKTYAPREFYIGIDITAKKNADVA